MRKKRSSKIRIREALAHAIFETLAYSDIFDYPLTGNQIYSYLPVKTTWKNFSASLHMIPHVITGQRIYYFLPGREGIVQKQLIKRKISEAKIDHIRVVLKLIGLLPTIRFTGISGSLACMSANKDDDSDIVIVTSSYTLWMTRFFVFLILLLLGIKRTGKNISHAICANMFLDEHYLAFPTGKRNLYIAHEIAQVFPVVNKNQTYEKFLNDNKWITTYFPNFQIPKRKRETRNDSFLFLLYPLESILRTLQLWYMKNKKTRETTTATQIAFHPIDYEKTILSAYKKKLVLLKVNSKH